MVEMYKYKKEIDITYFEKYKKTTIEDMRIGDIIYVRVNSPLNYGIKEWYFYGKLIKKTDFFFDILEYFGNTRMDKWYTEQIRIKENNPKKYTKRWAKKSIISIYKVRTEEKRELQEFESNNKRKNT